MNIEMLKKLGQAESKLQKIRVEGQKQKLSEFSDDPEVAKVLDYMTRYREELPDNHPIHQYIENLKISKENKSLAKQIVKDSVDAKTAMKQRAEQEKKEDEIQQKEREKKQGDLKVKINTMLDNLEKETDKIFELVAKNQKEFYGDAALVANIMKTRRFLISMKSGYKYAKIK